ncbi:phenylalanine--tRNA ligase subunit alpha [Candidatus Woesearchaeota archaeon]|nr:phenylalanine--tRNA ligase subunit alpha [Candidatus Woesearchaeota archaeon]
MELKKLIQTLHPLERKVLPALGKTLNFNEIIKQTGLKDIEVMRALQWLENKQVVKLNDEIKEVIDLGKNGKEYLEKKFPEKRFLDQIKDAPKDEEIIKKNAELSQQEFGVSVGVLKKNSAVLIDKKNGKLTFTITPMGKKFLEKKEEEDFLKKPFPVELKILDEKEKEVYEKLKQRKDIIIPKLQKIKKIELTDLGKKASKEKISDKKILDRLTPELLEKGLWKGKKFRRYDVEVNVPSISGGRKQHYRRFLDQVREKFMSLGFQEMTGPIVESDFWDMDALFMPQFHSARDIHQAYYVKDPEHCKLDEKIVEKVKKSHENGFNTGSKGWQYKFDTNRTKRNLLRTQGTACSARMLASKDIKIPGKYFGITRCFRYDVIDATHLPDFNQTEGIIIEEGLTLKHLFGLLKIFAKEFAETDEIKLVPGYFPFTEPSVELFAKHPKLGWIELGGAGLFRPELVKPLLGKEISVLAWGLGIDRIGMFKLGIKDIRQLFSHDLKFLRNTKME